MKLLVIVLALTMTAACASKDKASTAAPVQTETPATMKASQPEKVEAKKEVKQAGKKAAKKEIAPSDAAATPAVAGEVNCKAGTDERKLAIQPKDQGCELMYTKAGEAKSIASQVVGNEKCETVMASIKEKLTAAGFTCQ